MDDSGLRRDSEEGLTTDGQVGGWKNRGPGLWSTLSPKQGHQSYPSFPPISPIPFPNIQGHCFPLHLLPLPLAYSHFSSHPGLPHIKPGDLGNCRSWRKNLQQFSQSFRDADPSRARTHVVQSTCCLPHMNAELALSCPQHPSGCSAHLRNEGHSPAFTGGFSNYHPNQSYQGRMSVGQNS